MSFVGQCLAHNCNASIVCLRAGELCQTPSVSKLRAQEAYQPAGVPTLQHRWRHVRVKQNCLVTLGRVAFFGEHLV